MGLPIKQTFQENIMRIKPPKETINITLEQAEELILQLKNGTLSKDDLSIVCNIIRLFLWLQYSLRETKITMNKLKKLIFGTKSEKKKPKTDDNDGSDQNSSSSDQDYNGDNHSSETDTNKSAKNSDTSITTVSSDPNVKKPGHGRLSASDYTGAETVYCEHPDHHAGDTCPECGRGTLYKKEPAEIIRLLSKGLIQAIHFFLERYRCSACGALFTAPMPSDSPTEKYDNSAKVALAIWHYYLGLPFKRIEQYQEMAGIPFPDSTQFEQVEKVADVGYRIYEYIKYIAANSKIAYHDDTTARILSMMAENKKSQPDRKAMYTTAMVFEGEHPISLYITGRQHAGENLDDIVSLRDKSLDPILQVSDALAANRLKYNDSIWINCITHGRRNFVNIEDVFPEECLHVIDAIGKIYHHDSYTKKQGYNDQQRLLYHQQHSKPIMTALKVHMQKQLDDKIVEPNSNLGGAYKYMLNHWDKLTRFLTVAGAPLDNNTAERAVKSMIRYRNNSLFFKNEHGAYIGDVIISLVETCRMNHQNPEHYLMTLMENKTAVFANPERWLPWNYKDNQPVDNRSGDPPEISRNNRSIGITVPQQNL